jgi:hypothetical protein
MFHSPCWSTKPVSLRRDALQSLDEAFIADPEKKTASNSTAFTPMSTISGSANRHKMSGN